MTRRWVTLFAGVMLITAASSLVAQIAAGDLVEKILALAEQGNAGGQYTLGGMYLEGVGVPKDEVEGVRLFRLAAEQGHGGAQFAVGNLYRDGRGAPQDDVEAVRWFRLAAAPEQEFYVHAQDFLGLMYGEGRGVAQDHVESVRWHRLAAEQGLARAQYNLGVMYVNGEGVPQNNVRAYVWWSVALGLEEARANRDRVTGELTPEQLARGQDMATRCFESDYQDCE